MPKSGSDHVVFDFKKQAGLCTACKRTLKLELPMSVTEFVGHLNVFIKAHRRCKPKKGE